MYFINTYSLLTFRIILEKFPGSEKSCKAPHCEIDALLFTAQGIWHIPIGVDVIRNLHFLYSWLNLLIFSTPSDFTSRNLLSNPCIFLESLQFNLLFQFPAMVIRTATFKWLKPLPFLVLMPLRCIFRLSSMTLMKLKKKKYYWQESFTNLLFRR